MRLHVYPLDAVRFFAALCVLAFHLAFYAWAAPYSTVGRMYHGAAAFPELAAWSWFGWVGVEVFFVISGFVIANSANSSSPMRFAKSRALRLYPAVWVCAFITLAAWMLIDGAALRPLLGELVRSLSLWVNGPWIDGVYWTLAIEMMFYALIFLVLLRGRFAQLAWVALALVVCSGAYLVWRVVAAAYFHTAPSGAFATASDLLLLRHGCFFAVGILMWLATVRPLRTVEWAGVIAGAGFCCVEILLRTIEMRAGETEARMSMPAFVPIGIWLAVLGMMFVFARAPERFTPRSPAARALLVHFGKMTYPLYLIHAVVGAGLMRVLMANGVNPAATLGIVIILTLALASFVALYAEPLLRSGLRGVLEHIEKAMQRAPALAFLFASGGAVSGKTT
jgi:exopolysaccharide production protein ExoZ